MNGHNLVGVTHHEAVEVLKGAGNNVMVVVSRLMEKDDMQPLTTHQPARSTSTTSTGRFKQSLSPRPDDVSPPQPVAGGVELRHRGLTTSPTQSPAKQSLSPEPSVAARLSGTGSAQCEVADCVAVSIIRLSPLSTLSLLPW